MFVWKIHVAQRAIEKQTNFYYFQTANILTETLYDIDDSTYDVDDTNALVPLVREKHQAVAPTGHGAHVELIDVKCDAKTGMNVVIEFEEVFSGIIYSQGYFSDPKCRWVHVHDIILNVQAQLVSCSASRSWKGVTNSTKRNVLINIFIWTDIFPIEGICYPGLKVWKIKKVFRLIISQKFLIIIDLFLKLNLKNHKF